MIRKAVFVLLVALLLASVPIALADGTGDDANDTDDNEEIEVEDDDNEVGEDLVEEKEEKMVRAKKAVSRLHLTGTGIAISESDAFDFTYAKVAIGAVKVRATADDNVDSDYAVKKIGVLMLGGDKYHLKDIAVATDEISAEVYGKDKELVGEITVKRFEKPGRDVWAGNLVIDDKAYNIYLLGVGRKFKLSEITEKLGSAKSLIKYMR